MDCKKLLELKSNIDLLINGIDPQSKLEIKTDTILMSKFNNHLLAEVSALIDNVIKLNIDLSKANRRTKYLFFIPLDQRVKIPLSNIPVPISTFVYTINEHIDYTEMKKLRATQITNWLFKKGYLSEIEHEDGKIFKVLTEKSASIGMSADNKTNAYGRNYDVNLYNETTQKFILDHLDEIIDSGF